MGAVVVHLPAGAVEDEDAEVRLAEHGELLRLLQQPSAAPAEGGPPGDVVGPAHQLSRRRGRRPDPAAHSARCAVPLLTGDIAVEGM